MHQITLLDHTTPAWPAAVDALYTALVGEPLLPAYFVKTSFARIGGRVLRIDGSQGLVGMALLVPRGYANGTACYTLRLHNAPGQRLDGEATAQVAEALLSAQMVIYWPHEEHTWAPTYEQIGEFSIGAPDANEAAAMSSLHQTIWQSEADARFPADIHSREFELGTSLVARHAGNVVGFLLGFVSFGTPSIAGRSSIGIESQTMGVDPAFRRYGLAATLKRMQAQQAIERGFHVIHWTADPLQFANARLNFGRLRAIAGAFYPNYYPFRNALNRIHPSRFGLTWLLDTAHGQAGLYGGTASPDLVATPGTVVLNAGPELLPIAANGAPSIAIEIPADWTALQHNDVATAQRWRDTSDALLSQYIGFDNGRYIVTDAAKDGERCYLVATRADLQARLITQPGL
jgi:predicted GNAT superfamily acetyltransferase